MIMWRYCYDGVGIFASSIGLGGSITYTYYALGNRLSETKETGRR